MYFWWYSIRGGGGGGAGGELASPLVQMIVAIIMSLREKCAGP